MYSRVFQLVSRRGRPRITYPQDDARLRHCRWFLPGRVAERKSALTGILQGAGWRMDEILKSLPHADDFYCERLGLVKLEAWHKGRIALLGDAAYCPSPNTGMGLRRLW
jgi:2-polyprenyl-6-methoxyphenol hydroxylase-like FAD-dependent oxidoreductase